MSNSWGEPTWSADERVRRFNQEVTFSGYESSINGDEVEESGPRGRIPQYPFSQPKRQRTSATVSLARTSSLASSNMSPPSSSAPVRVKSEAAVLALEQLQTKPPEERVKVYVGKNNTAMEVGLKDLDKSPVLKSLISKLGTPGPYIMHPELMSVDAAHFHSIREFLLTNEYMPALVNNPHGENILPKQLDNCATPEHYRNEALRAGTLYVIAERLRMSTLQELVFRKITQAQFHPYGAKCLLDLAMVIFSRPEPTELNRNENLKQAEGDSENEATDPLENWLVESLKDQFQTMMINHARQFFRVSNHGACRKREFGPRILRSKVEDWDALGPDVVAIEDDE
ncbi:uncharacterized protein Z520_00103 [Fonsecaea multimorphosa CBS 102226]|uniref:BTB domain-containing protein n=1 Tax=Fonsecaea multimorphosa CBS 102226 TaxID=1442371 RepID=A0A0D2J233_9EURO|nr:uncharacterized protein Z520_00103 [Fonsecaea multimorphosa CBS 102226]KIY03412.1 hypothetical protein Z520_00103 [Fonsecaea multimorphosa CBS 102226]OAL33061.1 hypothetical protein AYO22_00146 [Fonsecaea multimorphosa]